MFRPEKIKESALRFLDEKLRDLLYDVEKFFNREKLKMIAEQKLPELINLVEERFGVKIKRIK